ncbi:hypothetical protein Tco_0769492 [Tanacetum coccineum]|uniref:Uncharacterized protein n=1 Tax=Tanacetum coccineum TaxID=301880 RepID=A0ABQ4ZAT5_9ASTR
MMEWWCGGVGGSEVVVTMGVVAGWWQRVEARGGGDQIDRLSDDQEEAEMKRHIEIVKDDEVAIDAIPLATKPPVIVEYKIDKDGRMGYFKLIRADGSSKRYSLMIKMLQDIDREDLETL